MGTIFEEKIIEIDNNEKYYVIKQNLYNDNIYLLANLLIDEETPTEEFAILKVFLKDDKLKVEKETDEETLDKLNSMFIETI